MATAKPQQQKPKRVRSLRIGIILGGKIIEEQLIRAVADGKKHIITVGQSAKNTFAIPIEGLPRTWPLFQLAGGKHVLNFTEAMDGRVSDGNQIYTIEQLKAGPAQRHANGYSLMLKDTARGKISLGELTILFQFVTAPPIQPRPKLPHSVRGSIADRIDPVLSGIMAVSIIVHGIAAYWFYHRDVEAKTKLELIAKSQEMAPQEREVLFTLPQKPKEPPKPAVTEKPKEEKPDKEPGADKKPDKKPGKKPGKKPDKKPPKPKDTGPTQAQIQEEVEKTAVIRVLTGGTGAESSRYSEMSNKDPGGDLAKGIKNAKSGGKITSRGEGGLARGSRGPDSGELGTGEGTGVDGPGDTGDVGGAKADEKIRSRTNVGSIEDLDETSLDPAKVAKTIKQRYLKGVRRCHEQLLKVDPRAGGRIEIEITVGKSGQVMKANVSGFDSGVDACIKALATKWRFPKPTDEDGKATEATFIMPFVLKPGS